ncbi:MULTISPECIES: signal recognition particle protein [unclassified Wenzhouxiangella]|uniref:signal recognition particle protein n=1 Tax=unclassified Wenzhouxiangella TaxID=2613841 RepID=UPI000E3274AE|nr:MULTISPECIES: signal recognition particle protein [unclassified Wenzhouxiangella]RFF26399.1 signal recognition particle protein [Wenzhouxiangella sp. 15181]RFP67328.1 signal recognition particle protein [Wenzhouxiangella sp. 15190]
MFDQLSKRLSGSLERLRSRGRLTEDNIRESLREVRVALLEADVALPVVKDFIARVSDRAVGQEVTRSLKPGQALVKVVHEELKHVLGDEQAPLNLERQAPVVILLAGLQGAGKTTTAGKLAKYLQEREKKKVMLASCDVYRPAAIDQLETLAGQVEAGFFRSEEAADPVRIAEDAVGQARRQFADVLILDTAGRLAVDEAMMDEIRRVYAAADPAEVLFVVDAMTGQDAANTAKAFHEALPLSGVVLTKTDGDARGGAALSVRHITGAPIKFLGTGEKIDGIEPFHPDRLASRILGMGDVLSLVEDVERTVDQKQAKKLAGKVGKGSRRFGLDDFRDQLLQMDKLGGMGALMDKLPGMGNLPDAVKSQVDDKQTRRMVAIINSMTPKERRFPDIIKGSRKRRIAAGSGLQIQDVNRLLKQHKQMQKMMKKVGNKGSMAKMMKRLPGGMPGGGGGMPF